LRRSLIPQMSDTEPAERVEAPHSWFVQAVAHDVALGERLAALRLKEEPCCARADEFFQDSRERWVHVNVVNGPVLSAAYKPCGLFTIRNLSAYSKPIASIANTR
jgi:hypothetical protein